jgi:hypothetical protein
VADGTGVATFPVAEMRPRGDRALLIYVPLVLLAPRRNMGTIVLRPFVFRIRTWYQVGKTKIGGRSEYSGDWHPVMVPRTM